MGRFTTVFEVAGVVLALCAWGLIPQLLWEHDYRLGAMAAFLLLPIGYFELACSYNERHQARQNLRHGPS